MRQSRGRQVYKSMRFLGKALTCEADSGLGGRWQVTKSGAFCEKRHLVTYCLGELAIVPGCSLFVQHTDQAVLIDLFFKLTWQLIRAKATGKLIGLLM